MNFRDKWPLNEKESLIQVRGLWRIVLPDDKHPETEVEYLDHQTIFMHRSKWTRVEHAERELRKLNEWKRQRGGRQVIAEKDKLKPRDYLHGNEIQHAPVS